MKRRRDVTYSPDWKSEASGFKRGCLLIIGLTTPQPLYRCPDTGLSIIGHMGLPSDALKLFA